MRNPVAKNAGKFNRASVEPNAKKEYVPSIDEYEVCCDTHIDLETECKNDNTEHTQ